MNAEDLPGGLKARAILKRMEDNPPKQKTGVGALKRSYVEALYADIRAVRVKGWGWSPIQKELSRADGLPKMSPAFLAQTFAEIDKEWEKKTGVKALPVESRRGRRKI